MKYKEIRKKYREAGWVFIRQDGTSHQIWRKGAETQVIAGKDGAEISKGILHKLLKRLEET